MESLIKVNLFKDKNMAKVFTNGLMETFMMVVFSLIKDKVLVYIIGLIEEFIVDNGDLIE
jgi:hypothetical protein